MQSIIEVMFAASCLIVGLSKVVQARRWAAFVNALIDEGRFPALVIAAFTLPMALLIVVGHNVWSGPAVLVTLVGWASLLKCCVYLLAPQAIHRVAAARFRTPRNMAVAGIIMFVIGSVVGLNASI